MAAGHALATDSLSDEDRTELSAAAVEEGTRLASLVDKLLDLSRLQAGKAEPRRDWVSLEDVLMAAREGLSGPGEVRVTIDPAVPEILADAAQFERAPSPTCSEREALPARVACLGARPPQRPARG